MTIRTHKMVEDSGDSNTGIMTAKAHDAPNGLFHMLYAEGSGTHTDDTAPTGLVFDNGDANTGVAWTGAANSCAIDHHSSNNEVAPVTGSVVPASPLAKSFMVWHHAEPVALSGQYQLILGNDDLTEGAIKLAGSAQWKIVDDSGNNIAIDPADANINQIYFGALFFDRDNGLIYQYSSDNGVVVTQELAVIDGSVLTDAITFDNLLSINAFAGIDTYGTGLFTFDTTPTPSQVLADLEIIRQGQLTAAKTFPAHLLYSE